MALDYDDASVLTGYARTHQDALELAKPSLAGFLPNVNIPGIDAKFAVGSAGLAPLARYRAFDADAEIGNTGPSQRKTVELLPVSINLPVTEEAQLRHRTDAEVQTAGYVASTIERAVAAVEQRVEATRGRALVTGNLVVDQSNLTVNESYGRDVSLSPTAGTLWSDPSADILGDLATYFDQYVTINGVEPGTVVISRQILRFLQANAAFRSYTAGGSSRIASPAEVEAVLAAQGLPTVEVYGRRTSEGPVLSPQHLLMLPARVESTGTSQLGSTFWGETVASSDPDLEIDQEDQSGLVAFTERERGVTRKLNVYADAIVLPVLANANLSLAAKVL